MSDSSWPDLDWIIPAQRVAWLIERTKLLGQRTRAFELALEQSAEAGEAPLSKVAEDLAHWEALAANIYMYVGLGDAKQVAAEDVTAHAEELSKVYENLRERRGAILEKLKDSAPKIVAREGATQVDEAQLRERAGELPSFKEETNALGGQVAGFQISGDEAQKPITADELRARLSHESKSFPETTDFQSLLNSLPPPWVGSIFETIGLAFPAELTRDRNDDEDDPDSELELTANSRSTIQKRLLIDAMTDELLQEILFALDDEDRVLLEQMLKEGGSIAYADAMAKYGKDAEDGFYWMERTPSGTIARLRRVGLAYVGMKGGKQLLLVPSDLVPRMRAILDAPVPDDEENTVV